MLTAQEKTLIQKAEITLTDITTNGGLLVPDQASRFIRTLIEQPTILNQARVVTMNSPKMEVNKIKFASRILQPASQADQSATGTSPYDGRYLPGNKWSEPTTSKVTLDTVEVMAEVHLPYEVIEDNIEREGFTDTLLALIAQRASLDIEDMIINGDTGLNDGTVLDLLDGVIKQTTTNVVDFGGDAIDGFGLANVIKAMPQQFRKVPGLKYYTTTNAEVDIRTAIASRNTGLGDAMLTGQAPVYIHGASLESVHKMPTGKGLYVDPKNIIVGFHRNMRMEMDRDIRARELIFVLTARLDVKLEEETAVVKYINAAA